GGRACSTWGDFHYKTFDGDVFRFPGLCNYVFSAHCGSAYEDFNLQLRRGPGPNGVAPSRVTMKLDGLVVRLTKGSVLVNGRPIQLPFSQSGVLIEQSNSNLKVVAKLGLVFMWNQDDSLLLELDAKYTNQTCGLCGDFNGVPVYNEFFSHNVKLTPTEFGNLQKMDGPMEQCQDPVPEDAGTCSNDSGICEEMLSSEPFLGCARLVNTSSYLEACRHDLCHCSRVNLTSCLCHTLAEYSRQCAHAGGLPLDWRGPPPPTPGSEEPSGAGPWWAGAAPLPTPSQQTVRHAPHDQLASAGMVLDDISHAGCVPVSGCSCVYNGATYAPGTGYSTGCTNCTCSGGRWTCQEAPCPGTCSVLGGAHISTFDEKQYRVHGDLRGGLCFQPCDSGAYAVLAELRRCGLTDSETCLKSLTLSLGHTVFVVKASGEVFVNQIYTQLPVSAANVTLFRPSTFFIIAQTQLGLQLDIQLVPIMQVFVRLGPQTRGQSCGLCGNFNQNQADDFLTISGVVEGSAAAFANTWKTQAACPNVKNSFEDPCSLSVENEKYAQHWCSRLTDPHGPFAQCHSAVDPSTHYSNCLFDTCNCEKSEDCMCAALSSYVRACAARGVLLSGWRDGMCTKPMATCPKSLTYRYNISTCLPTCRARSDEDVTCSIGFVPVDGCTCPDGTFLDDAGACVPATSCPCYFQGSVVPNGESLHEQGIVCSCTQGTLTCIGGHTPDPVCLPPMVYVDCRNATPGASGAGCQKSCYTLDMDCYSTKCEPGCVCPDGLVASGDGGCVPLSPSCPDALAPRDPCTANPSRRSWAQKQCSIINSATFSACHTHVEPGRYYEACVSDACACDSGGDCECFCTAVAAYAQACHEAGVCVSWRTPDVCPLFCDYYNPQGWCQWHYQPCGAPCLKTCRNPSGQCWHDTRGLEGCYPECPAEAPIFDEDQMRCVASCPPPSQAPCHVGACVCAYNGRRFHLGDVIYYTTDGLGGCISARCGANGTIERGVHTCSPTTPTPQTTPTSVPTSETTPSPRSTVPCSCSISGQLHPAGSFIYQATDLSGHCYYAFCNPDCHVVKGTAPTCPTSMPPPTPPATTSVPPPGCPNAVPPRTKGETWPMPNCSEATCQGNGVITVSPRHCPRVQKPTCANGYSAVQVTDHDGCCSHYQCPCVCSGWGDPHYITFDGTYYTFLDNCTYVLVQQIVPVFGHFRVLVENYFCDAEDGLSCPQSIIVEYHENRVMLTRKPVHGVMTNEIIFNGEVVRPGFQKGGIAVFQVGIKMYVSIPKLGVQVMFSGLIFSVEVPFSKFANNTEGQCGTCTNDQKDECRLPGGTVVASCSDMSGHWKVTYPGQPSCHGPPPMPGEPSTSPTPEEPGTSPTSGEPGTSPTPCPPSPICQLILSKPFELCHVLIPPWPYYQGCTFDQCHMPGTDMVCTALELYAALCASLGVCVDWRGHTNSTCPFTCPAGMEYWPCGPPIPSYCYTNNSASPLALLEASPITEGCFCPQGTMLYSSSKEVCVPHCKISVDCLECTCEGSTQTMSCQPQACPTAPACPESGQVPVPEAMQTGQCCPQYRCACDTRYCPEPEACPKGSHAIQTHREAACCPTYNCTGWTACSINGTLYQPGAVVSSSLCEKCWCELPGGALSDTFLINCETQICSTSCPVGFKYQARARQCCGECVQVACVINTSNSSAHLFYPGESWSDPGDHCVTHECEQHRDGLVVVTTKKACPPLNCPADKALPSEDGCCLFC
ncbi:Mucin-5AC, partial [Bos mutus]